MKSDPEKDKSAQAQPAGEKGNLGPAGENRQVEPDAGAREGEPANPSPKTHPGAPAEKKRILPQYSRRELAWLRALGIALLLIIILALSLFFRDVNTSTPDKVDFPVEGSNVVVRKIETFWRKVDREKDLGVQLSAKFIPSADVTLKSSQSGSLRFFFENPEGDRVGDPVTVSFSGNKFDESRDSTMNIHATGGLEDLGDYNEYLTEKVHFWHLIVMEGSGLEAEGSSYEEIIRMRISPRRR